MLIYLVKEIVNNFGQRNHNINIAVESFREPNWAYT